MEFGFGKYRGTTVQERFWQWDKLFLARSSKEPLSGGGTSSGPVSFMKVLDSLAGVVKSAGVTRRAARLGALNIDHPDIIEFVRCKADEEAKAKTLIENGLIQIFLQEFIKT